MPYKRKFQQGLLLNKNNPIPFRVQCTYPGKPATNVSVLPSNGCELDAHTRESGGGDSNSAIQKQLPAAAPSTVKINALATPQFNTIKRQHDELGVLNKMRAVAVQNAADLTPRTKATIAPRVTQKMNFHPDQAVFKNLLPLNVNDSVLEPKLHQPHKSRALKETCTKRMDPEPQLADYTERIEPIMPQMLESELNLQAPADNFDFLEAFNRVYDY